MKHAFGVDPKHTAAQLRLIADEIEAGTFHLQETRTAETRRTDTWAFQTLQVDYIRPRDR